MNDEFHEKLAELNFKAHTQNARRALEAGRLEDAEMFAKFGIEVATERQRHWCGENVQVELREVLKLTQWIEAWNEADELRCEARKRIRSHDAPARMTTKDYIASGKTLTVIATAVPGVCDCPPERIERELHDDRCKTCGGFVDDPIPF